MGMQLLTSPRLLQVTPINPQGWGEMDSLVHRCPFLMGCTEAVSLGKVTQHCHEVRTVSGYRWECTRKHITNHETLRLCGHCHCTPPGTEGFLSPSLLVLLLEIELGCLALGEAAFSADYKGRSLCLVHHWLKVDPGFRAGRHQKGREVSGPRTSSSTPRGRREVLTPPPSCSMHRE